jgi:hypothetical protein
MVVSKVDVIDGKNKDNDFALESPRNRSGKGPTSPAIESGTHQSLNPHRGADAKNANQQAWL